MELKTSPTRNVPLIVLLMELSFISEKVVEMWSFLRNFDKPRVFSIKTLCVIV